MAGQVGKKIANSLLVKTAIFGNDPNYGRILMALGNAGVPFDPKNVILKIGTIPIYKSQKVDVSAIPKAEKYLSSNQNIEIDLKIGKGDHRSRYYTCDISYEYVRINAEYTT